jgi:hypothetical protein
MKSWITRKVWTSSVSYQARWPSGSAAAANSETWLMIDEISTG